MHQYMAQRVNVWFGPETDLKSEGVFERAVLLDTEATRAPAGMAKHYNVVVTVKSKESGERYEVEVNSRRINNWLSTFKTVLREELESDGGLKGVYSSPEERNETIIEVLAQLVPLWINAEKLDSE